MDRVMLLIQMVMQIVVTLVQPVMDLIMTIVVMRVSGLDTYDEQQGAHAQKGSPPKMFDFHGSLL